VLHVSHSTISRQPAMNSQRRDERLQAAARKNAAFDLDHYKTLGGKLEYADLREVQDAILSKAIWPLFQARFVNKETLTKRFDQIAELRNGIHGRLSGGSLLGLIVAIVFVAAPIMERLFMPLYVTINSVPMVAYGPLAIIWLGIGSFSRLFFFR
jgi:hypothetical protein